MARLIKYSIERSIARLGSSAARRQAEEPTTTPCTTGGVLSPALMALSSLSIDSTAPTGPDWYDSVFRNGLKLFRKS